MITSNRAMTSPPARVVMVADKPILSTRSAPIRKPVMLPMIAAFVTQPAAVARTLVGNSSER